MLALALAAGGLLPAVLAPAARPAEGTPSPASCSQVEYGAARRAGDPGAAARLSPPNPDGPTRVGIGIQLREITDVAPVKEEFAFRGYLRGSWCDPRLAFDPAQEGAGVRIHAGEQAAQLLTTIWSPLAFPVNGVGEVTVSDRVIRVFADGSVEQDINVGVRLRTHYDLRDFPFDQQTLELQIESFAWHRGQLRLIEDETRSGVDPGFQMAEWRLESVGGRVEEIAALRSNEPFSRYVLSIMISRDPAFYVWKLFLPLVVIVAISWSIFWMPEERLAGRARIASTGVLTIVAYQFVFAGDLPRIGYLTLLDKIMIVSFGLLAATVLYSVVLDRYQASDPEKARGIDRIARWGFPATYALVWLVLLRWH